MLEVENIKEQNRTRIGKLSSLLRETANELELETSLQKSSDLLKSESMVKELEQKVESLTMQNSNLSKRLESMVRYIYDSFKIMEF